ncbi:MAG: enoyl-CoA hydratase/isomerase family protein [Alphaproteobacteria bacterium]|nr:enoyl-CoA hydratase/isomerase family protein [Alphaproteobacteria bacterium]
MTDPVLLSVDGRGIATVSLNCPDIANAFDAEVIARLNETFADLARRKEIRAVVLRGEGKHFSAGANLNWMKAAAAQDQHENFRDAMRLADMLAALDSLPMPTIARVQGAAMGGGTGLCACCDIAVAAESAKFAFSEVRLGILPGTISPYVLRAIGPRAARRYFVTGERFDAAKAREMGLVHEVVPDDQLDMAVDRLVAEILKGGPQAQRACKALVFEIQNKEVDALVRRDSADRIARLRAGEEAREGFNAFLEKRPAPWIVDSGEEG